MPISTASIWARKDFFQAISLKNHQKQRGENILINPQEQQIIKQLCQSENMRKIY